MVRHVLETHCFARLYLSKFKHTTILCEKTSVQMKMKAYFLRPIHTALFSYENENGAKLIRFGLAFTLLRCSAVKIELPENTNE